MNRAQRRKSGSKDRPAVYHFTKEQIDQMVRDRVNTEMKTAKAEAVNDALLLLLTLPLEVLMDKYWQKSYQKRLPGFVESLLDYYCQWENGELDMEVLKKDLWEYGGVRLEKREEEER